MNEIKVAGSCVSALSYFAALGLAEIASEELGVDSKVYFTAENPPRACIQIESASPEDLSEGLRVVAQRWAEEDSWVKTTFPYPEKKTSAERSPFSPRIKPMTDVGTLAGHLDFRSSQLNQLRAKGDWLALKFIAGLGEAAYWRFERNDPRPDHGASRWEMKTRNKGQEFVVHRLALIVEEIKDWSTEQILNGILGESVNDSIGKNAIDSRTSTGFTVPGPADVALTFAALVGMSAMPVIHQVHQMSVTPGSYPKNILHPRYAVLPLPTKPTGIAGLQNIILSKDVDICSKKVLDEQLDEKEQVRHQASVKWLKSRGVVGLVVYRILKTGSSSAPERQILNGVVELL